MASMGVSREEVERLVGEREEHRAAKAWSEADRVRDELLARNIVIMDGAEGSRWKVRLDAPEPADD